MIPFLRFTGLSALVLASLLAVAPLPAHAQPPSEGTVAPDEGGGGGSALYGYVGTGFLCALPIFILCKSARR